MKIRHHFISSLLLIYLLTACRSDDLEHDHRIQLSLEHITSSEQDVTYEGPNLSDNGTEIILRGTLFNQPAIFLSQLIDTSWTPLQAIITPSTPINNSNAKFISFSKNITSHGSINYNGPMVYQGTIVFAAELDNLKNGVFYSIQKQGEWITNAIMQTGDIIENNKVINLDAPYINKNKVYFLTSLKTEDEKTIYTIFTFDIPSQTLNMVLTSNNNDISQYWDMSLNKINFAIRGESQTTHAQNIYLHEQSNVLKSVYSTLYLPPGTNRYTFGGPSYFSDNKQEYVVNLVRFYDVLTSKYTALYSNIFPNFLWVATHDTIMDPQTNNIKDKIIDVGNPTLEINANKAWIAFQGTATKHKDRIGIYASSVNLHTIASLTSRAPIFPVIEPDDILQGIGTVSQIFLGSVSLRQQKITVATQLHTGEYEILLFHIANI
ncbi:hypothetical protein [uncultured Shewanella sp.]|uniref:hypothetical protein n=1 Tax=uncultured Shewanella sp. TaxID=173975 RepID=UPI0026275EA6|nr:hypothetical protein [uncultured Shewanella sp.]